MSHCSQKRWQMLQPQSSGGCWTHVWEYEELPVFRQPDTFVQPTWGHLLKVLQEMHSKAVLQYTSYKLHFTVFIINKFFLVSASLLFSNHLHYCCYEVNYPFLLYIFLLSVSIFDFGSSPPLSLSRRLNTASVGGCVTECSPPLLLFCWHLLLNNSNALWSTGIYSLFNSVLASMPVAVGRQANRWCIKKLTAVKYPLTISSPR